VSVFVYVPRYVVPIYVPRPGETRLGGIGRHQRHRSVKDPPNQLQIGIDLHTHI
jgi:hypothetical protein